MEDETKKNNDKPWLFKEGNAGGPGRPKDTPEQKIIKKATKQIIEEYKESLGESLPLIKPILIAKALEGNMKAIKEIHDRVMDKAKQSTEETNNINVLMPILVKFIDGNKDTTIKDDRNSS